MFRSWSHKTYDYEKLAVFFFGFACGSGICFLAAILQKYFGF